MKKEAWQAHVDTYNSKKQSVMSYANEHDLVYSQMLYWTRKLSNEPKKCDKPKVGFVAVEVKTPNPDQRQMLRQKNQSRSWMVLNNGSTTMRRQH